MRRNAATALPKPERARSAQRDEGHTGRGQRPRYKYGIRNEPRSGEAHKGSGRRQPSLRGPETRAGRQTKNPPDVAVRRRSAKRSAAGSTNACERNARASEGYPRQPRPAEVGSGDASRPWRRVGRGETPNARGESLKNAARSDDRRRDSATALPEPERGGRRAAGAGAARPRREGAPRSDRATAATSARGRSPRRTQAHATNQNTRGSGKRQHAARAPASRARGRRGARGAPFLVGTGIRESRQKRKPRK